MDDARLEMVRKYNVQGPRYTSYPSALKLEAIEDKESYRFESEKGELSLYVHLPFCNSLCWYCGCNQVITRDSKKADRYLDYLRLYESLIN